MPGRVDQERPAGQLEQLAMGGRVAAARVGVADLGRRLAVLPEQGVDERRLADPGRAQDRGGRARSQVRSQGVQPGAGPGRDRHRRDARRDRVDGDQPAVHVVGEVGLVEDDDRA